jgi:NAD(P)H-dependent flavin oxidoreductase YrpB (nitropropane dioxygenase family)
MAGQSCGLVKKEQTAEEIILELVDQTERVLGGTDKWIK